MRKLLLIFFLLSPLSGWSYLSIDTNELLKLTNQVKKQTPQVVEPPYIPSSYLKTGKLVPEPPQTVVRRLDIMFFITTPIIFYLTMNVIQQVDGNFHQNWSYPLDDPVERNSIFMDTLIVPLLIAYKDYLYLSERRKIDSLSRFSFTPYSYGSSYSVALFYRRF